MIKLRDLLRLPEFHIFLFCLCLILFSWPILAISGGEGLKGMFIYLYTAWGIVIVLLFLIGRSLKAGPSGPAGEGGGKNV